MKTRLVGAVVTAVLAVSSLAATAQANLILNGSFESPIVGSYTQYSGNSTAIDNWTVVGSDVLLINQAYGEPEHGITAFNAQADAQSVDLTGVGNTGTTNGIQQMINTVVGQVYTISFYVGRAFGNEFYLTPSTVDLSINGGLRVGFTNSTVVSSSNPGGVDWKLFTTTFVGTGSDLLTFYNGTDNVPGGQYGSANNFVGLDAVSVVATPEPASMVLFGLTLAGGLGGFGAFRRRKVAA